MKSQPPRYHAFISYSQAPDLQLARQLKNALNTFGKSWWQWRGVRAVLDTTTFGASGDLDGAIKRRLLASGHLIVLASRAAVGKPWVQNEIKAWLEVKGSEQVLLALTDGTLHWDAVSGDFLRAESDALPESLFGRFKKQPLWVDLRDARQDAAALRLGAARLAGAILDRDVDDLLSDELTEHRRRKRAALAAGAVLLAASGVAGWQMKEARREQRVAESREAAASALAVMDSNPFASLREAIRATELNPTYEAHSVLWSWLGQQLELRAIIPATADEANWTSLFVGQDFFSFAPGIVPEVRNGRDGSLIRRGSQKSGSVSALALSADGERVAVAGDDGTVALWNARTLTVLRVLRSEFSSEKMRSLRSLAWAANDQYLLAGDQDGGVRLWRLDEEASALPLWRRQVAPGQPALDLAISETGDRCAVRANIKRLSILSLPAGEPVEGPPEMEAYVVATAFVPKRDALAIFLGAKSDPLRKRNLRIWDFGAKAFTYESYARPSEVAEVLVDPNGTAAGLFDWDGCFEAYPLVKRGTSPDDGFSQGISGSSVAAAKDFSAWVTSTSAGVRLLWRAKGSPLAQALERSDYGWNERLSSKISADGSVALALISPSHDIEDQPALLNFEASTPRATLLTTPAPGEKPPWTRNHSISPSGKFAAWCSESDDEKSLVVWEIAGKREAFPRRPLPESIEELVLLDDQGTVILCPVGEPAQILTPKNPPVALPTAAVLRALPSLDGRIVFMQEINGTMTAWDVSARKELWHHPNAAGNPNAMDFTVRHEHGWLALLSDDHHLRLWKSATGTEIKSLPLDVEASFLSLSPDGSKLALSCDDNSIRLYSLPDLRLLVRMKTEGILSSTALLAFVSRDRLLVDHGSNMLLYNISFSDWLGEAKRLFQPLEESQER
jgi:WD40 repeat protein